MEQIADEAEAGEILAQIRMVGDNQHGLLMISNMIGSISLLPLLVKVFKPSFVMKSHLDDAETGDVSSKAVTEDSFVHESEPAKGT